jgi:hypothetical protein
MTLASIYSQPHPPKFINFLEYHREVKVHCNKTSVSLFSNTLFILKTLFVVEGEYTHTIQQV